MEYYIFFDILKIENFVENVYLEFRLIDWVKVIRDKVGIDIYLCGGGVFVGWLLENGLID